MKDLNMDEIYNLFKDKLETSTIDSFFFAIGKNNSDKKATANLKTCYKGGAFQIVQLFAMLYCDFMDNENIRRNISDLIQSDIEDVSSLAKQLKLIGNMFKDINKLAEKSLYWKIEEDSND